MSENPNTQAAAPAAPTESLRAPQTVIALVVLAIVAGTVAAVFFKADQQTINTIAGLVIGTGIGSVTGYYFGSSNGSQKKDAVLAQVAVPALPAPPPALPAPAPQPAPAQ